ncbi:MAG: hypothetical protein AB1938_15855 [Myxococcota bacterium]
MERTEAERVAAVESMYRIRAVESPPDADGKRTIWHRGAKGAELVTEVDGEGRATRHEFTLFDEHLIWEREKGFRAGRVQKGGGSAAMPASAMIELAPDASTPVLERAARSLADYRGEDKIISHLRELLAKAVRGRAMFEDLGEVTRGKGAFKLEERPPVAPSRLPVILVVGGLALVIAALVVLLAQ